MSDITTAAVAEDWHALKKESCGESKEQEISNGGTTHLVDGVYVVEMSSFSYTWQHNDSEEFLSNPVLPRNESEDILSNPGLPLSGSLVHIRSQITHGHKSYYVRLDVRGGKWEELHEPYLNKDAELEFRFVGGLLEDAQVEINMDGYWQDAGLNTVRVSESKEPSEGESN